MNDATGPAPLDLSALRGALDSLASGLSVSGAPAFDAQPAAWGNLLRAGLIQHFECCFELGVRMIKRQLERETEDRAALDAMAWRDMLRLAAERGLLSSPEAWFQFRELRNITLHTYDRAKADRVLGACQPQLQHGQALLACLATRNRG
ncbi:MAG: nucleotidyltransferase substrate binding protein [Rubrivivax sp.]|nr:nucleotidyltransferase substrate binding protein [Rubrivivax sp.]